MSLFCKQCLDNGHRCDAIEIDREPGDVPLCAFCEDNVPCPVMKRQADPAMRERPANKPMLQVDVLNGVHISLHPQSSEAVETFFRNGGTEMVKAAMKHSCKEKAPVVENTPKETQMDMTECRKPECGKLVMKNTKSGCCSKHYYWSTKNPVGSADGKSKTKLQRQAAKPAAADNSDRTVATLMVSEKQLDEMFLNWPLEDKVSCVQSFLDRMEA